MTPIQRAIQGAGGPAKVAAETGYTIQAVCFWRDGKRKYPAEVCLTLERMNNGAVRCEEMLPSAEWSVLRGTAAPSERALGESNAMVEA